MAFDTRAVRSVDEPLVISRTDDGFRVYAPADPTKSYMVTGSPEKPACTCPDYQHHEGNPFWRCPHITAVLNQFEDPSGHGPDSDDAVERRAIQEEASPERARNVVGAQMLLKRSVSPDGKIDSLSIEFSCGVDDLAAGDINSRAAAILQLQSGIISAFLGQRTAPPAVNGNAGSNGAAIAGHMTNVGGINTKWGRRLYIAIQANGQTLKFFGSRKQLADALTAAGYARMAERIDEGMPLNVACRVVTRPSDDGRYINIETILPAVSARAV